jgi:hypothetical protein
MSPLCSPLPVTMTTPPPQKNGFESPGEQNRQGEEGVSSNSDLSMNDHRTESSERLRALCRNLSVEQPDLLRFETTTPDGVRGIYLARPVMGGDTILKIPLTSCLVDDQPPTWLNEGIRDDPSRWATRLAASLIALYLENDNQHVKEGMNVVAHDVDTASGHSLWLSMLPDKEYLRASLPVHWDESTVRNARSTSLELAVDSAFFARAEAVEDLWMSLRSLPNVDPSDESTFQSLCHHALDLVQTRSCRLEEDDSVYPRRALAPVFDFINHGPRSHTIKPTISGTSGEANAYFEMETMVHGDVGGGSVEKFLVVRALRDLRRGEEVLIDYGSSARPAWKCLLSYGFVPQFIRRTSDDHDDGEDDENLAEVYMLGVKYEVTSDTVPVEMVVAATACERSDAPILSTLPYLDGDEENDVVVLTPDIAIRIARRISDAAYHLLLEPDHLLDPSDDIDDDAEEDHPSLLSSTPFQVISTRLAASLRWSQHRVLLACADGLRGYATERAATASSYSSLQASYYRKFKKFLIFFIRSV